MTLSRRHLLLNGLLGSSWVGLRALATCLPLSFLTRPWDALAAPSCEAPPSTAQFLVLSTSSYGDPINTNVPGTYDFQNIVHPPDPAMVKTALRMGAQSSHAARPWAQLPQQVLDRSCFFHHTTLTNSHANQGKVMQLMGAVQQREMLVSLYAKNLAPCLGTVQSEPVVIGAVNSDELLSFEGRVLPKLTPSGLRDVLFSPEGPLTQLQALRDRDLNRLNALFKERGTPVQRAFLDRLARSQQEARSISQELLEGLASIRGNTPADQAIAAAVLIKMKVAPVVSLHIPFGGDNHRDADLVTEAAQTVSGVSVIGTLMEQLAAFGLEDQTTFASMNVFGRTLSKLGLKGRDHHAGHHATLIISKRVRPGIIGGLVPSGSEFIAQAIESSSGKGTPAGDIAFAETLGALGKTLGAVLGVPRAELEENISTGKVVQAALV